MSSLDRYGGAGAFADWGAHRGDARKRELACGTCRRCRFSFSCEAGGCVCLWDPKDPCEVDPDATAAEAGCEEWEAA